MNFLAPIAGLVAAALVIPALVLLYFLKKRRKQVDVSTTMLWRKTIEDLEANAPFQKLRRNLLLLLQLLILAALLFAFARPAITDEADDGRRVIIAIDHSASMNARDGNADGDTRLEVAKEQALDLVNNLEADAAVVSFAGQARVLRSSTREKPPLRDAVRSIDPTDEHTSIDQLVRLIEPFAAAGADGGSLVVHLFSDGRFSNEDTSSLRGVELRYVRLGGEIDTATNIGIVSLSARRDFRDPVVVSVFARLINTAPDAAEINLTLNVDGESAEVRRVEVPGLDDDNSPGVHTAQFDLRLPDAAVLELSHDVIDALTVDNEAAIHLLPPRSLSVMLVTPDGRFTKRAIEASRVERLFIVPPETFSALRYEDLRSGAWRPDDDAAAIDVLVFDGWSPADVPPLSALYFNAVPPIEGLGRTAPGDGTRAAGVLDWRRDHPLLRHVALENIAFGRVGTLKLPSRGDVGVDVLVAGTTGPLIADVAVAGRHHVVVSFDVIETSWPMQVSFPVFVSNTMQWLGLGGQTDASVSYRTGEVAVVPAPPGASEVEYRGPAEVTAKVTHSAAVLPPFERAGLYIARDRGDPPWHRLPVNLADANESDIRPADELSMVGQGTVVATDRPAVRREIWRWFVWLALAVLGVEWIVYLRRMHL